MNNDQTKALQRVEGALFLQKILYELSEQLQAVRQEGVWTLRQRFSLWKRSLAYKLATWRLNRLLRRIQEPDAIKIPSRHGLVLRAIEMPCLESALDSLERRGEMTCCLIPRMGKSERRSVYRQARARGFDVRMEKRRTQMLIERLPNEE